MKLVFKGFYFICIVMFSCRSNSNVENQFFPIDSLVRNTYPKDSSLQIRIDSKKSLFNHLVKLSNHNKMIILEKSKINPASYEGLIYSFTDSVEYSYNQQNGKVILTCGNQFGDNSNFTRILDYTKEAALIKLDSMEKNPTMLMHSIYIYVYYLDYTNHVFRLFKLR